MNIYQRLEAKGWKRTSGNSRLDFYRKGRWMVVVPASTLGRVRFYEFQGEIYHLRTK